MRRARSITAVHKTAIPALVAALSIGAASVVFAGPSEKSRPSAPSVGAPPHAEGVVDRIVAVVDHRIITQRAVDRRMKQGIDKQIEKAPVAERPQKRREARAALLEAMIEELCIDDAAARLRVTIEEKQIDDAIEVVKQTNKIDAAGLAQGLAEAGLTDAEYRQELERQLLKFTVGQREVLARVHAPKEPDDKFQAAYEEAFREWFREQRKAHYIEVKP